jgi:hypothetical protein
MTGGDLTTPLTSSLDISYWLCTKYPRLMPRKHELIIRRILVDLHGIEALSLSTDRSGGFPCPAVDSLLAKSTLSTGYREALQRKRELYVPNFHLYLGSTKFLTHQQAI